MRSPTKTFLATALLAGGMLLNGCASTSTHESTGQYVDDSAITAKVKAALLGDDAVKSFEVHVRTYQGVVQLSGFVDNPGQRDQAGRDASGVEGVRQVQNDIAIKPGAMSNPPPDNGAPPPPPPPPNQ